MNATLKHEDKLFKDTALVIEKAVDKLGIAAQDILPLLKKSVAYDALKIYKKIIRTMRKLKKRLRKMQRIGVLNIRKAQNLRIQMTNIMNRLVDYGLFKKVWERGEIPNIDKASLTFIAEGIGGLQRIISRAYVEMR